MKSNALHKQCSNVDGCKLRFDLEKLNDSDACNLSNTLQLRSDRQLALMMKNKIYKALPAQAAKLSDLAFRSKALWGYSAEFMKQCLAELTYSSDYIENTNCYVLEDENQLVGFYILASIDQYNCELEGLFVEPLAVRKGYGRKLVDHAKSLANKKRFKKIIIQSDPNSVDFYIAMGAEQFGVKPSLSIPGRDLPMLELSLQSSCNIVTR